MAEGGRIHEDNRLVARGTERSESSFSSETAVDAEPEGVDTEPARRSPAASPMASLLIRAQGNSQPLEEQPKISIDDLRERLPSHVRDDYIDILIINVEEDKEQAIILRENIEQHVRFCKASYKPTVVLLDDIIPPHDTKEPLDYALKRTIYFFLYVTEEFCEQQNALFKSHSCLNKALNSPDEKWSVVPIHTLNRVDRKYELPVLLDSLRSLNLLSKTFFQDVKKLLEYKSHLILERKDKRQKELNEIIAKNCIELKARDAEPEKQLSDQTQCKQQSGSGVGNFSMGDVRIKSMSPEATNEDSIHLKVLMQLPYKHVNISQSESLADSMNDITIDSAPKQGLPDSGLSSMEHNVSIDGGGSLQAALSEVCIDGGISLKPALSKVCTDGGISLIPALSEVCTDGGASLQPALSKAAPQFQGEDCQEQTHVKTIYSVPVIQGSPSKLTTTGNNLPSAVREIIDFVHSNSPGYPQYLCQQASPSKDFSKNPSFHDKFPADTNHNTRMNRNQSPWARGAPPLPLKNSTPAPEANPGRDSSTQYNVNLTSNIYISHGPTHKTTSNYITNATNVALGKSHIDVHGTGGLEPILPSDSSDDDLITT